MLFFNTHARKIFFDGISMWEQWYNSSVECNAYLSLRGQVGQITVEQFGVNCCRLG